MSIKKKKNYGIFIICFLYFIITLSIFLLLKDADWFQKYSIQFPDASSYRNTANNLLQYVFFSQDGIEPDYFRTPGYPIFLAIIYFFGGNDITVIIIQILLATFGIYLFYRSLIILSKNTKLATIGSIFILFDLIYYQCPFGILSDSLFSFLIFLSLYFLIQFKENPNKFRYFVGFTFALNYGLLTRPILSYFNFIICVILLVVAIKKRIPWKCFFIFTIAFFITYVGWSLRNYYHSGVFVYSIVRNHNLLSYDASLTKAFIENKPVEIAREQLFNQFNLKYSPEFYNSLNAAEAAKLRGEFGSAYIKQNFGSYLLLNIQGLFKILFGPSKSFLMDLTNSTLITYIISGFYMIYLALTYIMYIFGLLFNHKKNKIIQLYIFLISGYCAIAGASVGYNRFRSPFFLLILFSAVLNSPAVFKKLKDLKNKTLKKI